MKHPICFVLLMAMALSLSVPTTAMALSTPNIIEKDTVVSMFKAYINTVPNLLDQDISQNVFKNFMELNNIVEDSIVDSQNPDLSKDSLITLYRQEMRSVLNDKIQELSYPSEIETLEKNPIQELWEQWRWLALPIATLLLLVFIIIFWLRARKKRKKEFEETINKATVSNNDDAGFVVRNRTISVMQKQTLEDVYDNSNYLAIDCTDFCTDSAVTRMYIKNTCIIDIYNMYAEDLRNPDNPKEDGCMVIGRWVHDEKKDEYVVSLEEVVFPGDDAIFTEYNLDFGGHIKMKMMERLKKSRRETECQYDLTCWVHSHPGLGVFFSNYDNNVHLIHKHPSHPKLLTAIVIDILTPNQELGVFTFKHDESINSKNDLKKLYSLVEWYKWAVESKRNSFKSEDHYNTLAKAKSHANDCRAIELTNGVIIDMDQLTTLQERELVHFVHGFIINDPKQNSYVAVKIDEAQSVADYELVGCFVMVTNRSLPSVIKATANYLDRIKFVLAYSSADGLLTTIPVINNELCTDETYYGEQQLEDLKIWTRRKR